MPLKLPSPTSIADFDGSWREDIHGNIVVRARVGPPIPRHNYQHKMLPLPKDAGLVGWERAHCVGPGTGFESAMGIFYAPKSVNQQLQNRGVERVIRELQKIVAAGNASEEMKRLSDRITLVQTVAVASHKHLVKGRIEDTFRLKEIDYMIEAYSEKLRRFRILFEAWIELPDSVHNPQPIYDVEKSVSMHWDDPEWIFFMDERRRFQHR